MKEKKLKGCCENITWPNVKIEENREKKRKEKRKDY
jgi:hypothetical protein